MNKPNYRISNVADRPTVDPLPTSAELAASRKGVDITDEVGIDVMAAAMTTDEFVDAVFGTKAAAISFPPPEFVGPDPLDDGYRPVAEVINNSFNVPGYEPLAEVLRAAYDQSARGKGKSRHAKNPVSKGEKPFNEQPIMAIGRMCGVGYQAGQVQKKAQEACTMFDNGNKSMAQAELLGCIVYAAAMWQLIEESK